MKDLELLELDEQALPDRDRRRRQQARRIVGLERREIADIARAAEQVAAVPPRIGAQQVSHDAAQAGVGGELLEVPAGEVVQPLAQVAAVDAQGAV